MGINMTNEELIKLLEQFDKKLEIYDTGYSPIEGVKPLTWVDGNYPYDKPDKDILIIY